ncbi:MULTISPECIES: DUF6746 family protein [Marinobacter]|uniref:DUF6746 family protein n=1 Tax=Marinobacter TaxID=2742 RepID=UPI00273F227B|nr:DUF6746 family protein [Marinobacter salsuginis]
MKKPLILLLTCAGLATTPFAFSDEVEHFKGEPAKSLEQAVNNFSEYNSKLEQVLDGELTPEAMGEVHKLTYTLENALGKINAEFDALAATLETIHVASEHADPDTVKINGEKFLSVSRKVIE